MAAFASLENPRRGGSYEFHAEKDHDELLERIAKVRLAKAMKIKGHALDRVDWVALDGAAADRELERIGGVVLADDEGRTRIYGGLTEEEFDLVLEPKASWEQFETLEDKQRLERQRLLIRDGS